MRKSVCTDSATIFNFGKILQKSLPIFDGLFSVCPSCKPTLANNCYLANIHWCKWPNNEQILESSGHTGLPFGKNCNLIDIKSLKLNAFACC